MDATELTRQIASRLHEEAVAAGNDPLHPYDFAVAEANRRGVDVESAVAGAAVLNGGRATFVAEDDLIVHEAIGTAFERAFLVAHEIAHIELGDDPDEQVSRSIDLARSGEPSSGGFEDVVDYGRHQRREIQMDLFAREFLLPRDLVRRLHIDEELSGSEIAERYDAPFEVVAQQLLDALLLPATTESQTALRKELPLNDEQRSAAMYRGGPYLLEAGPGTGKTQTLTARIEGLIAEGADPRSILVLTFSNKAAAEMAERIASKNKLAATAIWIGTFHAFGLDLVRRFHAELDLPRDPRMMDRTEAVELLEAEFPRLNLVRYRNVYDPTQIITDILGAISRAKDEVVDHVRYAALSETMRRDASSDEDIKAADEAIEVAKVYEAYETLKRTKHCVDFGDLVSLPVRLLEEHPEIRAHLAAQYDHILVDEYQDVNRSSIRLLRLLKPNGANLWAVGDAKQSIYRFRGASSFNMARFDVVDFPGGCRGRLKTNYRSVSEVVDSYSAFAKDMIVGGPESGLDSNRGPGGRGPECRLVERAEHQVVALADAVEEMRAAGYSFRDQVVLCTGNEKLSSTAQELERMGVPVLFLGSLFEREEVRDLLAYLSLISDGRAMGLLRVGCWPEFELSLTSAATVIEALKDQEQSGNAGPWSLRSGELSGLDGDARSALDRLSRALEGYGPSSSPWEVLAVLLLNKTRMLARLSASSSTVAGQTKAMAIWQFMNFLRAQPAEQGERVPRLLDRVRRLVRLGDERDLRQLPAAALGLDAVRLMTIHSSKGLEFPVVHVTGMNADTLPRAARRPACLPPDGMIEGAAGSSLEAFKEGHQEEQECLFYVAASRAKDRLFLYAPTKKSNGHKRSLSPFVGRLGPLCQQVQVALARTLPAAPGVTPISIAFGGNVRFSGSQLSLYESCQRRFFYTHIVGIGGRRTATPFAQMHEAAQSVIEAVFAGDQTIADDNRLRQRISDECGNKGLGDHGYRAEYEAIAFRMVKFLLSTREGCSSMPHPPMILSLESGEVNVQIDEALMGPTGETVYRRVRTGHLRSTETKDIAAWAFMIASQASSQAASLELVHLSDETVTPVKFAEADLPKMEAKVASTLGDIRAGIYAPDPSPRTCPGCPAFFVCGTLPSGNLLKKA